MRKRFNLIVTNSYDEMSNAAYKELKNEILSGANKIGLATGSTPIGLYRNIVDDYINGNNVYSSLSYYNLDEYHGLEASHPQSYSYFMKQHLFNHINATKTHIPDGACDIEKSIREYQDILDSIQIDVQVLGIGVNGHIGFNEPSTPFDIKTNYVKLKNNTREANKRFFDNDIDAVPKNAITMGISDIMKAKKIIILANGESKATAIYNMIYGEIDPLNPASVLQNHPNVTVVIDRNAASKLPLKTVAIDISSTRVKFARYDHNMKREMFEIHDIANRNPIELLDENICDYVDEDTYRIGASVSGHVFKGCVSSKKLGLYKYDLSGYLKNKFNLETKILNRANAAGYAEHITNHKDNVSSYYFSLATGVGGGFVFRDEIIEGRRGVAGELGNLIVDGVCKNESELGAFERTYDYNVANDEESLKLTSAAVISNIVHILDPNVVIIDIKHLNINPNIVCDIEKIVNDNLYNSVDEKITVHEANVEHNSLLGLALYMNRSGKN